MTELQDVFLNGSAIDVQSYELTFITPMMMHGVNARHDAEFRASSLKGIYRYWWRALQKDANTLEQEVAYFGGTSTANKRKSPVTVLVKNNKHYKQVKANIRPHRAANGGRVPAFESGQIASVELRAKKGQLDASYIHYWEFILHVGSFGQRARRGFGACQWHAWETVENYVASLQNIMQQLGVAQDFQWQKTSSHIVARRQAIYTKQPIVENIYIGAPKNTSHEVTYVIGEATSKANGDGTLGSIRNGRWASPLHCTVRKIGEKFYPIITEVSVLKARNRYEDRRRQFLTHLGVQL